MAKKKNLKDAYSVDAISYKLEQLFELQSVDSSIDKLTILRGELPIEVADLENEIEKLNELLTNQSDVEEELNNSIVHQQQKIQESTALIDKYNAQQSKVRNNREFDAINKELEFQSLEIQLSNKKIKSIEEDISENKTKIKLLKAKVKERKKHLKDKKDKLSVIVKSTEIEEKKLLSKKKKLESSIEEKSVLTYNNLRNNSKNGLAVVKIARGACGGCFNSITSQHILNINMRKDVYTCESCGIILVPDNIDGDQ